MQNQPGNQSTSADATAATDTVTAPDPITAAPDLGKPPAIPDTQFIIVDSMVNIKLNNESVPRRPGAFDSTLAAYWMQCYNSEKKLPAFLRFKYQGTVMMGARGNLLDQVVHVQDSLRDHIAQEKYQQGFKQLNKGQQKEMQKDFPVLFQKRY
jgi:hypothetical protein